jgi:hypothetical protein
LSEAKKEILDEVGRKCYSRSCQYLVGGGVHKFLEWKAVEDKKITYIL